MHSSFTVLPATAVAPEALPVNSENINVDQLDISSGEEFGELLGEAYESLSADTKPAPPAAKIARELIAGLQELPESGNPLPLLDHSLQLAAAEGVSIDQLFEQVSVKLETLAPSQAEPIAEILGQAVLHADPAAQGASPDLLAREAAGIGTGETKSGIAGHTGSAVPAARLAELIHQQLQSAGAKAPDKPAVGGSENASHGALRAEPQPPFNQTGLDRAIQQVQHQPVGPEGRHSDLAVLLAAFKRQQSEGSPRVSTTPVSGVDASAVGAAGLSAVVATSGGTGTALPSTTVQTPFGQANWDQAVGERIQWMVGQKMQNAQVKLNPANLGPMEVRIQVQNDQVSVQFSAHHAAVRDALESALPRLKDMFEATGVELVDVDVSGHSFDRQQAADEGAHPGAFGQSAESAPEDAGEARLIESDVARLTPTGRLDLFA